MTDATPPEPKHRAGEIVVPEPRAGHRSLVRRILARLFRRVEPRRPEPPAANPTPVEPEEPVRVRYDHPLVRWLAASLVLVAALQGTLFLLAGGPSAVRAGVAVGALVAAVTAATALRGAVAAHIAAVAVLEVALAAVLVIGIASITPPYPLRGLTAALILVHAGLALAVTLSLLRRQRAREAFLLAGALVVGLVVADQVVARSRLAIQPPPPGLVRWDGPVAQHPVLGAVNPANEAGRSYFPTNLRNYFAVTDTAAERWALRVQSPAQAELVRRAAPDSSMRVAITRADSAPAWHIQLTWGPLRLRAGQSYRVRFRARADVPRPLGFALGRGRPPWGVIGSYQGRGVGQQWDTITAEIQSESAEPAARLQFDLGGDPASFEVAGLTVREVPDGPSLEPVVEPRYYVEYRFNDRGCRGPSYATPRPPGTVRILTLGDSYTLGMGIHFADTYQEQLSRLLAASDAQRRYEVINCGVSGYSTREERQFYELIGAAYEPDLVLVMMVANDDRSWLDDVRLGYFRTPSRLEHLFALWGSVQAARHRRPEPDYSGSVAELRRLDAEVRRRGARLVVGVFHNGHPSASDWPLLTAAVSNGLRDTGIPLINLDSAVHEGRTVDEIQVYPGLDAHPSPVAHQAAARALAAFLREQGLVPR